jgi:hypothetical protein
MGRQLKQSVNVFHNFTLNRLLPAKHKHNAINMQASIQQCILKKKSAKIWPHNKRQANCKVMKVNHKQKSKSPSSTDFLRDQPCYSSPAGIILTFIIKAVNSVDAGTLMIASEEEEILWIFDLVRQ